MTDRWRCFVAVPLDDALRSRLADAIASWKGDPRTDGLRWVEADALHLTLAFLGDVDPSQVAPVAVTMREVAARHRSLIVATGRLGAFSRPGSARVLWYGVFDAAAALASLGGDLATALGLEAAEPYRPHVTLARARRRSLDLRGWIEDASESAPDGRLEVAAVRLMRSHLGHGPARYETLTTVSLQEPAP
jgi:2'-5' RNA ligase